MALFKAQDRKLLWAGYSLPIAFVLMDGNCERYLSYGKGDVDGK